MADEKKYPYTTVPNNLRKLLQKLPDIKTPEKATQRWLESIGFSGGNNKTLLPVLRHVGVISKSGEPTDYWVAVRSGNKAKVAEAVRAAYADLFAIYDNAHAQDSEALTSFFRTHTRVGEKALTYCVRTFKVLTEFGDFETPSQGKPKIAEERADKPAAGRAASEGNGSTSSTTRERSGNLSQPLSLTVNLQIELPPSAEGEVYDKLFAAMAKHLKGLITPPE
jgi:hypothetical protein